MAKQWYIIHTYSGHEAKAKVGGDSRDIIHPEGQSRLVHPVQHILLAATVVFEAQVPGEINQGVVPVFGGGGYDHLIDQG